MAKSAVAVTCRIGNGRFHITVCAHAVIAGIPELPEVAVILFSVMASFSTRNSARPAFGGAHRRPQCVLMGTVIDARTDRAVRPPSVNRRRRYRSMGPGALPCTCPLSGRHYPHRLLARPMLATVDNMVGARRIAIAIAGLRRRCPSGNAVRSAAGGGRPPLATLAAGFAKAVP